MELSKAGVGAFLEAVGEEFERLTDGYYLFDPADEGSPIPDPARRVLRLELEDERLYLSASHLFSPVSSPAAVAIRASKAFDRRERQTATEWRMLGTRTLEELDGLRLV